MRKILPLLIAFLLVATGCPGEIDDEDARRANAKPVPLGQVVTDQVSPPEDEVDWKIIEVPGGGFLTVTVFWDNVDADGLVTLTDKYGVTLEEERRDPRTDNEQIIVNATEPTFYFVKVTAGRQQSVYSVQTSFSNGSGGLGAIDEPIPEFVRPIDPGEEGDAVETGGGGGGGGGQPALPPLAAGGGGGGGAFAGGGGGGGGAFAGGGGAFNGGGGGGPAIPNGGGGGFSGPSAAVVDIVPDYTGPYNPVEANIVRVIPRAQGGAELTISVGSQNGVAVNHVGEILMRDGARLQGGRFLVSQVYARSAVVQTNAPANQVGAAVGVLVKVPR